MAKRIGYIASPDHLKEFYALHEEWSIVNRVPVSKIRIDPRLFSYPNPVYEETVKEIVEGFELDL
jgi:hypothetical protein